MGGARQDALDGLPVLLSASLPDELRGTARALDLQQLLVALLRGLLAGGGRLVFGGHPSVTPLVDRVASQAGFAAPSIELYQLTRYRHVAPPEVQQPTFDLHWVDSDDLSTLRDTMARRARAAIFVGGRTAGNEGGRPGIRDEYQRFVALHPRGPAYLLGLLDGEALRLIREHEAAGESEPNSLTPAERRLLHSTADVDLAVSLVLADLRRTLTARAQRPPSSLGRRRAR